MIICWSTKVEISSHMTYCLAIKYPTLFLANVYNFIYNIPFPDVMLSFVFMASQENALG